MLSSDAVAGHDPDIAFLQREGAGRRIGGNSRRINTANEKSKARRVVLTVRLLRETKRLTGRGMILLTEADVRACFSASVELRNVTSSNPTDAPRSTHSH